VFNKSQKLLNKWYLHYLYMIPFQQLTMETKKTFLIAGARGGIGSALAKKLIDAGCAVIAIDRQANNSEGISAGFTYDFASDDPLPQIADRLDGLVYCPGSINLKPFGTLKPQDLLDDFNVNVLGAFKFLKAYQNNLRESDGASVVLFSSVAAQIGMPYHTSIGISKAGIEGMTKALAAEFAPKIRVNCIAPSLTETPLAAPLLNTENKRTANADRHPMKRIGTPQDIAALAAFLLLDAGWITGQIIGINGGLGTIFK